MKTLFEHADILLRKDGKYVTLNDAYLGVTGDTISYIGKEKPTESYDLVKDMTNKLLMAGLVNAHGHSPMTLLRGLGSGLNLQDWLNTAIFPVEDKLTPEDIYLGCKLAIAEMLAGGTTCFSEMYDFPFGSVKAAAETGIKMNVDRAGICLVKEVDISKDFRMAQLKDFIHSFKDFTFPNNEKLQETGSLYFTDLEKAAISSGRIVGDLCLHSVYATNPTFVNAVSQFNKEQDVPLNIHASETVKEVNDCLENYGLTPIEYFEKMGVLRGKTYLAHCVHVTKHDLEIIAKTSTSIVHNPSSNLKLGSGIAKITEALSMGINVALGTDGCASNNNLDMFEEMHLAAMIQTGVLMDSTVINVNDIIDMATINGAKALSRKDTGLLEVGYKADIIALDLDKPHLIPNLDSAALIVYSAHGSDVCMTMVDGEILYENGKYFTLDIDEIKQKTKEFVERMYK